ncbi:MAG: hypothetical protein JXR86_02300 [Spirochaetales bacterium]|nr:hypothetical protein [Spirochaetales bacterium]
MRKKVTKFLIAVITLVSLSAETSYLYDSPFGWQSPEILAQGGSFVAVANGFNALMTNPAGFSMSKTFKYIERENEEGERVVEKKEKGEMTVLGVLPYAVINPYALSENLSVVDNVSIGTVLEAALNQSSGNSTGAGVEAGIGYVGHGFGIGFINTLDMIFPPTDVPIDLRGDITATSALVFGYAHKFNLGNIKLSVGADIRPMWRVKVGDIPLDTVFAFLGIGDEPEGADFSSVGALSGYAVGFDAGAILEIGMFSIGASLRDIGHTRFTYQLTNLDELTKDLLAGDEYSGVRYITPMSLRLGAAIHPDLGRFSRIFDPKIHLEYVPLNLVDIDVSGSDIQSFPDNVRVGAEIRLLSFLSVRAGYASGYLSAGLGVDFVIGELNAALYSIETVNHPGLDQPMGASVEFAFRF